MTRGPDTASAMPTKASSAEQEYFTSIADLWCRGWSLIPVEYKGKRPVVPWTEYQNRCATFDELERWFGTQRRNIGIVTGSISGIFVLDADSPDAIAWAEVNMPPCNLRVRTARGAHYYFPYSGSQRIRNRVRTCFNGRQLELDIRGEGGFVVGPGSEHASGFVYVREGTGWE